jgi:hypothetical protein
MTVALTRDLSVAQAKAGTLIEALPWLARFHGATVEITGIRPASIRSVTARTLTSATSPTRPTSTGSPST